MSVIFQNSLHFLPQLAVTVSASLLFGHRDWIDLTCFGNFKTKFIQWPIYDPQEERWCGYIAEIGWSGLGVEPTRAIWNCCWPQGISSPPSAAATTTLHRGKSATKMNNEWIGSWWCIGSRIKNRFLRYCHVSTSSLTCFRRLFHGMAICARQE